MTTPDLRQWLADLADVGAMIPAKAVLDRLPDSEADPAPTKPASESDRLLTVVEAAERLGVDRRWLYRRANKLPFTRKLSTGTLRFSERALIRWTETRK